MPDSDESAVYFFYYVIIMAHFFQCLFRSKFLFVKRISLHVAERTQQQVSCLFFFQIIPVKWRSHRSPESIDTAIAHEKIFFDTGIDQLSECFLLPKPDEVLAWMRYLYLLFFFYVFYLFFSLR